MSTYVRPPPAVTRESGPSHLYGIPYSKLTKKQAWEMKVWRFTQYRCILCGYHQHDAEKCPKKIGHVLERHEKGQCGLCGKAKHDESRSLEATSRSMKHIVHVAGPKAPYTHLLTSPITSCKVYHYPSQYTDYDMEWVRQRLLDKGIPIRCNCKDIQHWHICPRRLDKVNAANQRKLKEIASVKKVFQLQLTGPFGQLAADTRLEIFKIAFKKEDGLVAACPGYIPTFVRNTGFNHAEALKGWLASNEFRIESPEGLRYFLRLLTTYGSDEHDYFRDIHALRLASHELVQNRLALPKAGETRSARALRPRNRVECKYLWI